MSDDATHAGLAPAPVLEIRGLKVTTHASPAKPILEGIDFSIAPGETLCLVGESGSGKSVTSLAVMGLLPKGSLTVTGGRIELEGNALLDASPKRLRDLRASRMAMIFQEPMTALNPLMRVGEQIEEVLVMHQKGLSSTQRRERVLEMLDQVQLPDIERVYASWPHQLSGGQRQRIMIAMALILEPKLLIADEPTTALDVTTQKQILKLIKQLQERHGTSVLFITHDMGVVADIADRVCVMRHGEVVETQPIEALLRRPKTDYTRQLLTAVPSLRPRAAREVTDREIVLEAIELEKRYGQTSRWARLTGRASAQTLAASEVNFALTRGRTLGIVGESGSGKSTVARCVMRMIEPTAGGVRVMGKDIASLGRAALRPHRKRIQMIFQDPFRSLNPRLTIGASLIEGPVNYGTPRGEALARAAELLALVGLPKDALARYPHQFSGGQRQRIAIARALAMEPDVLVADEAVSALDVSVQAQVLALLDDIQRRLGVAVLFITHDLRVAAQICDEVMVMQKGVVVEYGPASRVLGAPEHPYTRSLMLAAPGRHWDFSRFRPLDRVLEETPASASNAAVYP
ncbi:ABC transporter ATP-binding protein [Salinicola acroporae]|uniref:ABC-type dipeptide transporter n=1 Tax=Salinicola acroporae TaxID=1541440 RepID=A0ABT6I4G1_9GAMM|nr:ABC transporter ATP-binding protein [Salinicola acroporae]MDH4572569.1 microcin ABC transporter ATP-binding protein [Salinicola acroporae]